MVQDSNGADVVSYVIDTKDSGIGDSLQIPGWKMHGWSSQTFTHDYGTTFGETETPSAYSAAQFSIEISRPLSFFYWKLLMPLTIVLLAALSALLLSPRSIDARTGLPAGALLTAIFLQKSYSDGLPDLGYLILMDQIYLVAYALIVLTLIRAIFTFQRSESVAQDVLTKVAINDRTIMVFLFMAFAVATAVLVWSHS